MTIELQGRLRTPPIYQIGFNQTEPLHPVYSLNQVREGIISRTRDSSFRVEYAGKSGAISVWRTPKRTRTYPYSRMYDTLNRSNCRPITIIPIVIDEGLGHDRDFLGWDSVSLTSYVDIYAILGYYVGAQRKSQDRVTKFKLDWTFLCDRIVEVLETDLPPLEWNNRERASLGRITNTALEGQEDIQRTSGVPLNDRESLVEHLKKMSDPNTFRQSSRTLSAAAQGREASILQRAEEIVGPRKNKITLSDAHEGTYNWTIDEVVPVGDRAMLIDKKSGRIFPAYSDIADSFFRMIFFTNIVEMWTAEGTKLTPVPAVALTGKTGEGACFSACPKLQTCDLINCTYPSLARYNDVRETTQSKRPYVREAFKEGLANNFLVYILGSRNALHAETEILMSHTAV